MKTLCRSLLLFSLAATVHAQAPLLISYQGRLVNGTNLVNGNIGLALRLYSVPSGGSSIYQDSNEVTVADGIYSTFIGDNTVNGSLSAALTNAEVWLEAEVNGVPLLPRERVASSAYALTAWNLGGNTGTSPTNNNFLGTADNRPLEMRTLNQRVARFDTATNAAGALIPNVIFGHSANLASNGTAFGSAVGGGGNMANPQIVGAAYDTIAGGVGNRATGGDSTVAGGRRDVASGLQSSVGGGFGNVAAGRSSTVGGGSNNVAGADFATVPGGAANAAMGAYSFAARRQAKAQHNGTFIWADSNAVDFVSTADNQFLVRAGGGVGIGANVTPEMLSVAGNALVTGSVTAASFSGDGSGLTGVDAETLQGSGPADFAAAVHTHDGADIVTGTVAEAYIDATIARDSEIFPAVLANDGSGSTLDADLLDGNDSTAFAGATHSHDAADISTGTLDDARLSTNVSLLGSSIDNAELADGSVTSNKIDWTDMPAGLQDGDDGASYTAGEGLALTGNEFSLTNEAVTTAKLADGAVTVAKLDAGVDARYVNTSGDTVDSNLVVLGSVGIGGTTNPASALSVGLDSFQVDSSGNAIRIRDVPYSWPSGQGAFNTVLRNDGSGGLSWAVPSGGGGATNAIPVVVTLHSIVADTKWNNMPLALTEFMASTRTRTKVDLSAATQARVAADVRLAGSTLSKIGIQFSTNQTTWAYLDGSTSPRTAINTTGVSVSAWANLTATAKQDVFVRVVGQDGNGTNDPSVTLITLQLR